MMMALVVCMAAMAAGAHEIPDEGKKGTITVEMEYGEKAVQGGTLKAYRVGQIQESNGDYIFVKTKDMAGLTASYDDLNSANLAEAAAEYVKAKNVSAYATAENKEGKVVFNDLELGLYLIVQTEASDGYEPIKPFLVSLPMTEEGHYVYEVNAEGKFELVKEPTPPEPSTPTTPTDPELPQTGQLNWPIPILAAVGLVLFGAGWLLRYESKKKVSYEK